MSETTAKWTKEIPEGAFLCGAPSYEVGKYFDLFEEDYYKVSGSAECTGTEDCVQERDAAAGCANGTTISGMKYYFYDPTAHGYPKKKDYPILIFLHGATNSLVGKTCVSYCGAEHFASPKYQEDFKGSYILIPIANEYRDENGELHGCWDEEYAEPLRELIEEFLQKHTEGIGKKFLLGNSAGAWMTFRMGERYPDYFDALIPVSSADIPTDEVLDRFEECGVSLFFAIGKRDEFHDYAQEVEPRIPKLQSMKHCFIYTPEWVKTGNGGICSIAAGVEMGQHCLMNAMQENLLFEDGTPMDERLPEGFTGWIDEVNRGAM